MNFSRGHSGTKVRYVNRACFPKEKHQNSQKWAKFMNFSFWPFFWFGLPGRLLTYACDPGKIGKGGFGFRVRLPGIEWTTGRNAGMGKNCPMDAQKTWRGILMPRGNNCRETIFAAQLPRNYPHRGGAFERGKKSPLLWGERQFVRHFKRQFG